MCTSSRDGRRRRRQLPLRLIRNLINFWCILLQKSCTGGRDGRLPTAGAKIPTGVASQLQVEEILFMADINFKALPPAATAAA